ncbi:unnamed protein product [Owenia fusiformis]|uniref:Uncharacterized protein n=1 Tax=Owenia fusiformis TaxID=6347 RepID=A0A8J1TPR2_OWEFU|nr:unnamed protein product [Owenia fusiformis]
MKKNEKIDCSVLTLLLAIYFCWEPIRVAAVSDCNIASSDFTVASGTICRLTDGDYSFDTVSISGTVQCGEIGTENTKVTISVTDSFEITKSGILHGNGFGRASSSSTDQNGNAAGSGGKATVTIPKVMVYVMSKSIECPMF